MSPGRATDGRRHSDGREVILTKNEILASLNAAEAFIRIDNAMNLIEAARHETQVRFWFDATERFGREFHSLNSTYLWAYSQVGTEYPAIHLDPGQKPGVLFVVPSEHPGRGVEAAAIYRRPGLRLKPLSETRIQSGGQGYFLNLLQLENDPYH